ncbi:S-adenosyl methyltransferase [Streptomyces sp. DconLS]|nr:S-adenosyl methyltransferase [Streptomyces sp. LamerLS-31b]SCF82131.1 S-adenosyl methyltransferase [Streptomyces sp. DconLS]
MTEYIQADAREPGSILERATAVLDFDRPVALSLIALLHFVADEDGPPRSFRAEGST